ncbi:asparagine synthase (glutamine-hydrolyzing) [Nitrogeniibacter aestuarii]|uniref:asparagine synthase (glutamine-hydrolyzing) n=1 Tax=Nitrogeniibacter aestuarii TaxID=2815343 RepID=UPI001D1273E4|nr:asparagine synthase (glutamine-hydrolyzing) [Nitrogeniibacter aestuarii]
MCGIHGIYRFDRQTVEAPLLSAMGQITQHRGPDDEGMHIDGECGIGMRRLSIIDLAGGHQPLSDMSEQTWLVCNGEIYNFRELRAELEASGHRFKTGSDCEVLLHLYRAEGDEFIHRLNGMFNFALWDAPRRRLLIGRDRLGVKPLYLYRDSRVLAFATEAKALFAVPGISPSLNREALSSYLTLGYVAAPHSMFEHVEKLPPATMMSIDASGVRQWQYWKMPATVDNTLTEADWIERTRVEMEAAVHRQMVSDVPIGAFLSGGVDSSAVVGFMARHSDQPIKTYAIGFDGGAAETLYNELPYARRVAELFGTEHREIVVKPDVVSLLPKLLWHMDEPIADTAFITTYLVSQFARQDVTVILSGVGGDELYGGYRRYLGQHYQRKFDRIPGFAKRLMGFAADHLPADRHSKVLNLLRLAKGFLASEGLPADVRYANYLRIMDAARVTAMLGPDAGAFDPMHGAFEMAGNDDELNRMFAVDAATQLPDDLLLLTDKMSMAVSLECRVPLLDHTLAESAATMPAHIKVKGGRLKHVMKQSLADLLPDDILNRKKRGFGTPMGAWLKRELAPLLNGLLNDKVVGERGLFDAWAVTALIRDHESNRMDGTDALIALMNLEIWSRMFLDGRSPDDVATELKSYV